MGIKFNEGALRQLGDLAANKAAAVAQPSFDRFQIGQEGKPAVEVAVALRAFLSGTPLSMTPQELEVTAVAIADGVYVKLTG